MLSTPLSAYSAANAGVHALVRNLAIESAHDRIRINAVAPAVVETPVFGTFLSPEGVKEILPTFNGFHPLGRNGQPEDVAEGRAKYSGWAGLLRILEHGVRQEGLEQVVSRLTDQRI
jgi:NAD(P)-dependent dehydrogenase (short-subunit alcohol dehydrogenase family)